MTRPEDKTILVVDDEEDIREYLSTVLEDAGFNVVTAADGFTEITADRSRVIEVLRALRDRPELDCNLLLDVCGVDYAAYGDSEWVTTAAANAGFGRGAVRDTPEADPKNRFAAVYHLLSVANNQRLRVRCYAANDELPIVPSVIGIWSSANWYEREAFDLYGILFDGHPDLRRLLTDYGFIGHPFRKDFPLIGNVEVRYDPDKGRVVYEPVSIEPRTLVPRVIRKDNRYEEALHRHGAGEAADG